MARPSEISVRIRAAQKQVRLNFERAVRETFAEGVMKLALRDADLSDHTLADLAELDHPYSRRHPENSLHDDRKIHRQSGTLQTEFRDTTTNVGGRIFYTLRNAAHYWPFLRDGTKTARPRRLGALLDEQIKTEVWPKMIARLRAEFRAAFR